MGVKKRRSLSLCSGSCVRTDVGFSSPIAHPLDLRVAIRYIMTRARRSSVRNGHLPVHGHRRLDGPLHELGEATRRRSTSTAGSSARRSRAHGGVEVDTQGDAILRRLPDSARCARSGGEAQRGARPGPIRVRIGIHTGAPRIGRGLRREDVHEGARIAARATGGRCCPVERADGRARPGEVTDLGEHRLKDFARPVRIYQLGSERFPPLKTISNTNLPARPARSWAARREVRRGRLAAPRTALDC